VRTADACRPALPDELSLRGSVIREHLLELHEGDSAPEGVVRPAAIVSVTLTNKQTNVQCSCPTFPTFSGYFRCMEGSRKAHVDSRPGDEGGLRGLTLHPAALHHSVEDEGEMGSEGDGFIVDVDERSGAGVTYAVRKGQTAPQESGLISSPAMPLAGLDPL